MSQLGRNTRLFELIFVMCLLAMFAFSPHAAMSQAMTPSDVVRELLSAMDAKSSERIGNVFSKNASQAYGEGQPKSGDAFRKWLESDIVKREGRVLDPQLSTDGNSVVVTGEYVNNLGYRSAANFLFKVENGKILLWQMRY